MILFLKTALTCICYANESCTFVLNLKTRALSSSILINWDCKKPKAIGWIFEMDTSDLVDVSHFNAVNALTQMPVFIFDMSLTVFHLVLQDCIRWCGSFICTCLSRSAKVATLKCWTSLQHTQWSYLNICWNHHVWWGLMCGQFQLTQVWSFAVTIFLVMSWTQAITFHVMFHVAMASFSFWANLTKLCLSDKLSVSRTADVICHSESNGM